MITVELNSRKINMKVEENTSLSTLIPILKTEYGFKKEQKMKIKLNGHLVSTTIPTAAIIRPLIKEDHISIELNKNPYSEIFYQLEYLTTVLISNIETRSESPKSGAAEDLSNIITGVGALIKTSYFLSANYIEEIIDYKSLPIKNLQIHLLSVMKGIETAHKAGDDFMLEDLLEFELKDNLTKWKILVIPTLKAQLLKNI